jgi:two-component system response regulator (stage 0 sporulation protein F)
MKRILIVDDDESIRLLYKKELADQGYDVMTASDGSLGLESFIEHKPDLVVLDVRMPGIDGLETLGQMLAKSRDVLMVLNTAYSCYKDSFLSWMADAYVRKSSDLTELKETINSLLNSPVKGKNDIAVA